MNLWALWEGCIIQQLNDTFQQLSLGLVTKPVFCFWVRVRFRFLVNVCKIKYRGPDWAASLRNSCHILLCTVRSHVWCAPTFLAQTFRKKPFILIFNSIIFYLYLDTCFCIIMEFWHLILNILWYKKFYVTNNYKTQEQIQSTSGTTHG